MAEDRFKRFRHLERPRQPGGAAPGDASPGTQERFGALEERRAGEKGPPHVADGHLDRFRPAAERPLDVATAVEGELPFVRCATCQMDHNRTASSCSNCGADLRTDAQRAFNARLAEERRAQAVVEAEQAAALERGRREADEDLARTRRAMGESLAREVGEAERRRLDAEGLGGGLGGRGWGGGWTDGSWTGGGWGRGTGWRRVLAIVGWILLAILRVLFAPRRRWRRW